MLLLAIMVEERRSASRARISGVRVTYESTTGDHVETDALNLGRGGLFVGTASPLAVGKRIALEIQVIGEPEPWAALGRVVWTRENDDGEQMPPGMGVKLIDIDETGADAIERLVEVCTASSQAHQPVAASPTRERTILGIGSAPETAPAVPVAAVTLGREKTILGIGSAPPATAYESRKTPVPGAAREPSVAIDLVSRKSNAPLPVHAGAEFDTPAGVKRGGGRWVMVVLLLAAMGTAAYVVLDGDLDRVIKALGFSAAPQPMAAPARPPTTASGASSAATPAASTSTIGPVASATGPTIPSAGASGSPSAVPTIPPRVAPSRGPTFPATGNTKRPAADNPY
jgi:uncharacterized protein (TIGR02266 family)